MDLVILFDKFRRFSNTRKRLLDVEYETKLMKYNIEINTNQFPNPPIIIAITMKKIMTKAWAVTMTS
jgi:hypothetical protein